MKQLNREVVFTTIHLPHYRIGFHQQVAQRLAEKGYRYKLVHSDESAKSLNGLPWVIFQPTTPILRHFSLHFQPLPTCCRNAAMLIIGQETKILSNYPLLYRSKPARPKIAFFGHGRNYQSRRPRGYRERFKEAYSKKADWFFAYTDGGAQHLGEIGFPRAHITSVQNAIDMRQYLMRAGEISPDQLCAFRAEKLFGSSNVGAFIGRFYKAKRLGFLIAAATIIRRQIPDFQLVLIGDGAEKYKLKKASAGLSWVHFVKGDDQNENALYLAAASLQLAPGLVGLNILDGFAFGLPMVTCANGQHSPEIEYLRPNENGLIVTASTPDEYANEIVALLRSPLERTRLSENAKASAYLYSQELMAERFCHGVVQCLCTN